MRGIRITKGRGTSSILSSASPCMHRYQAAHVCTVCYAHARNALRTQSNRKPRVFQFMSRPRTVWTPVVFEILVEASPLEASVALEFSRFRLESSAIRIAPSHLRYRHLDSMLAYILGFFYFYAELLRLELQMLVHPEDYKLSKFMLWTVYSCETAVKRNTGRDVHEMRDTVKNLLDGFIFVNDGSVGDHRSTIVKYSSLMHFRLTCSRWYPSFRCNRY